MKIDWKKSGPIFLLGLLLGAAGGSMAQRAMMRHWKNGHEPARMVEKMGRELQLDAGQKEAVKAALESTREKISVMHQETEARFEALRAATRADIRKLLTPEQQAKFDVITARHEARMRSR